MRSFKITQKTSFNDNESYEGETIETKIMRIVENKEPIEDGAPLIYTERKDGVQPEYNVRTDKWEIALDAMDKVAKTNYAKSIETPNVENSESGIVENSGSGTEVNTGDNPKTD